MVGDFVCVKLVEEGAESKDVDRFVVASFFEEFWSHVCGCAAELHGSVVE